MNTVYIIIMLALFAVTMCCLSGMAFDQNARRIQPLFAIPDRLRIYATICGCSMFLILILAVIRLTGNFPDFVG